MSAPTLGTLNKGTDNNLNLLRVVAAIAVALSHSYLIVTGDPNTRPLVSLTGYSVGYHSVNIFFVISGFLVTQSWVARSSLFAFSTARSLRIFPGLFVCTVLTTLLLGPAFTELPVTEYLTSPETIRYFLQTASLVEPDGALPGLFTENPDASAVNGSLWTLRYELICYMTLAIIGVSGVLNRPTLFLWVSLFAGLVLAVLSTQTLASDSTHPIGHVIRFGLCFGLGIVAFQYREVLVVHWTGVAGLFALSYFLFDTALYSFAVYVTTAYSTLWLAYVPNGRVRLFNKVGDYSYGFYIYAFPIQQSLISLFPNLTPEIMFILTVVLTLPFAVASWHLIEKACLRLKPTIIEVVSNRQLQNTLVDAETVQSRR